MRSTTYQKQLKALVSKGYEFVPVKEKGKYYRKRTRPRRAGKAAVAEGIMLR